MSDEDLKAELERLRAELARPHDFQPTPEQINALPEKLRHYIHRMAAITDPAGDQAAIVILRENVEALTKLNAELRAELDAAKRTTIIVVVDYDPAWPTVFEELRAKVWTVVNSFAVGIEHIGSTSVPGLAAKPIIDMAVVIPSSEHVPRAIESLATLGYAHRGDLGVKGREAFRA